MVTRDAKRLPLNTWQAVGDAKAVIIALHSFRDYRGAYDELGRWFAARGVTVYAYDQRGFGGAPNRGLWAGSETMAGDLRDAIEAIRKASGATPVFLAGESMGAAVIMTLLGSPDPPDVNGIILAAPALRGKRVRSAFGNALLSLATVTMPGNKTRVRQRHDPKLSAAALERMREDPLVLRDVRVDTYAGLLTLADTASAAAVHIETPALLLFGANDRSVTLTAICHARSRLAGRLTAVYYNQGPHLVMQMAANERAFGDVEAWMMGESPPSLVDSAFATNLASICRGHQTRP